jgi:hypothetical protein
VTPMWVFLLNSQWSQLKIMAARTILPRPKLNVLPLPLPEEFFVPKCFSDKQIWDRKLRGVGQSFWDGGSTLLKSGAPFWLSGRVSSGMDERVTDTCK